MSIIILVLIYLDTCWMLGYVKNTKKMKKIIWLKCLCELPLCDILLYVIIHTYIIIINFKYLALGPLGNEIHEF